MASRFEKIKPEDILIRPLLYDALSGEFSPPTDQQKRSHTMGRLVVATITKGVLTTYPQDPLVARYTYEPSWAPNVTSHAVCAVKKGKKTATFWSAHLYSELTDSSLDFYDADLRNQHGLVVGKNLRDVTTLPLELGDNLNSARTIVTQHLQEFFDRQVQQ